MALHGVPFTDNDNDGWAQEDGDCDDDNADVNPEAEETPGDGVDSNVTVKMIPRGRSKNVETILLFKMPRTSFGIPCVSFCTTV